MEMDGIARKAIEEIRSMLASPIKDNRLEYYPQNSRAHLRTVFDEIRMREFTLYYTMSDPGDQMARGRRNEGLWCDMLRSFSDNFSENAEGESNLHADYWYIVNLHSERLNFPIQHKCVGHRKSPITRDNSVMLSVNWSKNPTESKSEFRIESNVLLNWWTPTGGPYKKYRSGAYLIPREIVNEGLAKQSISTRHNKTNTAFGGDVVSWWMDYCLKNELVVFYTGSVEAYLTESFRVSDWTTPVFEIENPTSQTKIGDY